MRKLLLAAIVASLGLARAAEPSATPQGGAEARPAPAEKAKTPPRKHGGKAKAKPAPPAKAPGAAAKPEPAKPCEPVKPCPIDG